MTQLAPLQASLWYNANKPTERASAERGISDVIEMMAKELGLIRGPMRWIDLPPDEVHIDPPEAFSRGVRYLEGVCPVVKKAHFLTEISGFTQELDKKDLERLREQTRMAHRNAYPREVALTDAEADDWINELGPEAAQLGLQRRSDA